ncbi:hypothetical protein KX816_18580 [Sphingosinicellaceae bacterium]|nr:hypothetical protein KX816_18580 [Sphingosinicellaceae bacterium]
MGEQKRTLVAAMCEPGANVAEIALCADLRPSQRTVGGGGNKAITMVSDHSVEADHFAERSD